MADRYDARLQPIEIGEYVTTGGKEAKPVSVKNVFALCFAAGIGVAVLAAAVLFWFQAPEETLLSVPPLLGLSVFGALLLIRAIPWEWIFTVRMAINSRRMIAAAQGRENEAYRRIRQLITEHAAELEALQTAHAAREKTLERALDRMTAERDQAKLELERFRNMAKPGRQTYVAKERQQSEEERDARKILDRWYGALLERDRWTPRRDAPTVLGISEGRHTRAVGFLERAGIVVGQRVIPATLDAALQQLSDYATESGKIPMDAAPFDWTAEEE